MVSMYLLNATQKLQKSDVKKYIYIYFGVVVALVHCIAYGGI